MPSQKELTSSIRSILKTADLDSLSAKQVRKQLEKEHGCELTQHKKFIDDKLMELIDEMGSGSEEEEAPVPKKKRKISSDKEESSESDSEFLRNNLQPSNESKSTRKQKVPNLLGTSDRSCKKAARVKKDDVRVSPELGRLIGAEVLPRSQISLRLHQEVLSRQLHEGHDRMYIVCDEEFKAVFGQDRLRVSTLTNHCKKHIFKIEKEHVQGEKKKKGMYSKPVWLSPHLADILGYNQMSRSDIVKEMWRLIKSRGLQDPKNKKFMLVEGDMMPIFKQKRIQTFGMMKYLANHIAKEDQEFEYSRSYPVYDPESSTNGTTEGS